MSKHIALALLLLANVACGVSQSAAAKEPGARISAQIAEIMVQNRVYETATPLLRQGLAIDPNNPRLHRLLGVVLRDRGVYEQALPEFQIARRFNPWDPDTAAAIGVLYDLRGQAAAAEMWHREALRLSPARGDLYNNLGFSMAIHGDSYGALAAYSEALRRNPNQPRVYNNMGFTYAKMGRMGEALVAFRQGGSKAQAQANMGLAYELRGDLPQAKARYEAALRLDHNLEVARQNLRNITENAREQDISGTLPGALHQP